jgi:WD40 repeat protein
VTSHLLGSLSTDAVPASQRLLYITHARQDDDWVRGVIIPSLGLIKEQYWMHAEDDLGALKLEEIERAVQSCRYTLLVASRAARIDEWTNFGAVLAQHLGIEERKLRLLIITRDFDPTSEEAFQSLPLRQRCLVCLDCSDPERREAVLASLAAQLRLSTTKEPPADCPYPGLRVFGTDDSANTFKRIDLFFGRDEEGRDILDMAGRTRCVLLVGPSGCGKSSLIRARVLPALSADLRTVVIFRPTTHPDAGLLAALNKLDRRLGPACDDYRVATSELLALPALLAATTGASGVLFIDQLEEVFLDHSPDGHREREQFFAHIMAVRRIPGVTLLLSMRADFYGDLMRGVAWNEFKDHRVELAPLRGSALRQAITQPAEACGVYVEVDLVERLVREAELDRAAEALPLLQVALEQLWEHREWRYVSLTSYERIAEGNRRGLDVVLARHADAVITGLDESDRPMARRALIDLVQLGEGRPDTRRRRTINELRRAGDDDQMLFRALNHLSRHRLVSVGADTGAPSTVTMLSEPKTGHSEVVKRHVDLAHDALITGWPALIGWISERRDDVRIHRRLEARAEAGGVLTVSELAEFTSWVARVDKPDGKDIGVSQSLRELVRRSTAARRRFVAGVVTFIIALSIAAIIAVRQQRVAAHQRDLATQRLGASYQEQGRQYLLNGEVMRALPFLSGAYSEGITSPALRMLLGQARSELPSLAFGHALAVNGARFSRDGVHVVTASRDGTARVWSTETGAEVTPRLRHGGNVRLALFSPDGSMILTASEDGSARLWNAGTGQPLGPVLAHQDIVTSAAFDPHGTLVGTASFDGTARLWNLSGTQTVAIRHEKAVNALSFSPDGRWFVTASADGTARIWDTEFGQLRCDPLEHQNIVESASFSPDGSLVVTASDDNTARVWRSSDCKVIGRPLVHEGAVRSASFSSDGSLVVTASRDNTARLWKSSSGEPIGVALRHADWVEAVAFSGNGQLVVTAGRDKVARVWKVSTGDLLLPPLQHRAEVLAASFSPDGRRLLTSDGRNAAWLWDLDGKLAPSLGVEHRDLVSAAALSSDGARVAIAHSNRKIAIIDTGSGEILTSIETSESAADDKPVTFVSFNTRDDRVIAVSGDNVHVFNLQTGESLFQPLPHPGDVRGAFFSTDGSRIVTASWDAVRVWNANTGHLYMRPIVHDQSVTSVSWDSKGRRIVSGSEDGFVRIWDADRGNILTPLFGAPGSIRWAAFSASGRRVVATDSEGSLFLWSASDGRQLITPIHHAAVISLALFSKDSERLLTAGRDGIMRLWEIGSGTPLTLPMENAAAVRTAAFSDDDGRLIAGCDDGTAQVWDMETARPLTPVLRFAKPVLLSAFDHTGEWLLIVDSNGFHRHRFILDKGTPEEWRNLSERCANTSLVGGVPVPVAHDVALCAATMAH